ncbi:MAG: class I SAM-dependent methyltransferase [Saprospiraceae bacterium]|nr:class I SAM-dependent methyltransferase [Saprospiraceae bacterium]
MLNSFIVRIFFRVAYWYINSVDKLGEVTFLNYGYFDKDQYLELKAQDEKNRYSIQLYHLVATAVDVQGKDILEVACGRGGGLNYILHYLYPKSATGVDLNEKAILFCKNQYQDKRISFLKSNAEHLNLMDESFDVVINIESCHAYPHLNRFLSEVHRVLRPGGYLLLADFRPRSGLKDLRIKLVNSGLKIIREEMITNQVYQALKLIHPQRSFLIKRLVPWIFRAMSNQFAALEGTSIFKRFSKHKMEYVHYVLQKAEGLSIQL